MARKAPRVYTFPCGCMFTAGLFDGRLDYCPQHSGATAMAALLKRLSEVPATTPVDSFAYEARTLLRTLEG